MMCNSSLCVFVLYERCCLSILPAPATCYLLLPRIGIKDLSAKRANMSCRSILYLLWYYVINIIKKNNTGPNERIDFFNEEAIVSITSRSNQ